MEYALTDHFLECLRSYADILNMNFTPNAAAAAAVENRFAAVLISNAYK